jgi:hypothetical protein
VNLWIDSLAANFPLSSYLFFFYSYRILREDSLVPEVLGHYLKIRFLSFIRSKILLYGPF